MDVWKFDLPLWERKRTLEESLKKSQSQLTRAWRKANNEMNKQFDEPNEKFLKYFCIKFAIRAWPDLDREKHETASLACDKGILFNSTSKPTFSFCDSFWWSFTFGSWEWNIY